MSPSPIDLWWFRLDRNGDVWRKASELLDADELARYRQFARQDAGRSFALRRAARRVVLSEYFGIPPPDLRFAEGHHGKPAIEPPYEAVNFSASDCGGTGIIAVSFDGPVGVDLERVRALRGSRLIERILSPAERLSVEAATPSQRDAIVLRAWTAKEAIVKGIGLGLDLGAFRQITTDLDDEPNAWRAARLGAGLENHGAWHVREISLPCGPLSPALVSVAATRPRPLRVHDASSLLRRHGLG